MNNSEAKEQQRNFFLVIITVSPITLSDTFLTVANNSYSRQAVFKEKDVTLLNNSIQLKNSSNSVGIQSHSDIIYLRGSSKMLL